MCSFKYKSYLVHSFSGHPFRETGRLSLIPRHRGKAGGKQKKSASCITCGAFKQKAKQEQQTQNQCTKYQHGTQGEM
jgi:hypothetical protein